MPRPVRRPSPATNDPFDDRAPTEYTSIAMQSVKAQVKNGRLVLDEPTDLPEGTEVTLSITDDEGGDYDDEERERINESLAVSFEQARMGQLIDADVVLARLRARR